MITVYRDFIVIIFLLFATAWESGVCVNINGTKMSGKNYFYFYCNHCNHLTRSYHQNKGFSHSCHGPIIQPSNHSDQKRYQWNKSIYVTPNKPFSRKATQNTSNCSEHQTQAIEECFVPVTNENKIHLQQLLDVYKFKADVRRMLNPSAHANPRNNQTNTTPIHVSSTALSAQTTPMMMDIDGDASDEDDAKFENISIKQVRICHDETNNAFFQGFMHAPVCDWNSIVSNTALPKEKAQQKVYNMRRTCHNKNVHRREIAQEDDVYPYMIIHTKKRLPLITRFMRK
eukprot:50085_1